MASSSSSDFLIPMNQSGTEMVEENTDQIPIQEVEGEISNIEQVVEMMDMSNIMVDDESGDKEIVTEHGPSRLEKGKNIATEDARIPITTDYNRTASQIMEENQLAEDIKNIIREVPVPPCGCFIYRTPEHVHNLNEAAYTPRVVSIGPYHNGHVKYKPMEGLKRKYCMDLIERNCNTSIISVSRHMLGYERLIRDSYENIDSLKSSDLLAMIQIDGVFILEYMLKICSSENDRMSQNFDINHDILLQENQIPFDILNLLFKLIIENGQGEPRLIHGDLVSLVLIFLRTTMIGTPGTVQCTVPKAGEVMHITDLIRYLHDPKMETFYPNYPGCRFATTATQLYKAGVKFKTVSGEGLLNIRFQNRCLHIPTFEINDDRVSLYKNLMVLELCHYPNNTFITDYFIFMVTLIDSSDDVNLLVRKGVLYNRIGHYSDTANIFNNFCGGGVTVRSGTSYLRGICEELNEYYKVPSNTCMTTLKRDYFGTPFRIASTSAGALLLLLTLVSTLFAVLEYFK